MQEYSHLTLATPPLKALNIAKKTKRLLSHLGLNSVI